MAKKTLVVTKTTPDGAKGSAITGYRLSIDGRSMWLGKDALPTAKLVSNDTALEVDDEQFNPTKFDVLRCTNEHGAYLKLVPKTGFKLADF